MIFDNLDSQHTHCWRPTRIRHKNFQKPDQHMSSCRNCGAQLTEAASICQNCRAAIEPAVINPISKRLRYWAPIGTLVVAVAALIVAILAYAKPEKFPTLMDYTTTACSSIITTSSSMETTYVTCSVVTGLKPVSYVPILIVMTVIVAMLSMVLCKIEIRRKTKKPTTEQPRKTERDFSRRVTR